MTWNTIYNDPWQTPFEATPSGLKADGSPCWKSDFWYGGRIVNNNEVGIYADPLDPMFNGKGADPFPLVSGKRRLRAGPLSSPIVHRGKTYNHYAALISRPDLRIKAGDFMEARFSIPGPNKKGGWGAFWAIAHPKEGIPFNWPPEIDILEAPQTRADEPQDGYFLNQHWATNASGTTKADKSEYIKFSSKGISGNLSNPHTYRLALTKTQMTFSVDGIVVSEQPNMSPDREWMPILNMSLGGVWPGSPDETTQYPVDMILNSFTAKRYTP